MSVWSVGPCDVNISFEKFGLNWPYAYIPGSLHTVYKTLYHGCGAPFLAWNLCVEHVHNFTTSYWNVSITLHPPIAAEEEGSCDVCMEHGDMHWTWQMKRNKQVAPHKIPLSPLCQVQTNNMFKYNIMFHEVLEKMNSHLANLY